MIPKVLHLYWGRNRPLSFMRWLTAASFAHYNPGWKIVVRFPRVVSMQEPWRSHEQKGDDGNYADWFIRLARIRNLVFRSMDPEAPADASEVHKSDFLRWQILSTIGGVWSDFDVLYTAPMHKLEIRNGAEEVLCYQRIREKEIASVGFLMSMPDSAFFAAVLKAAQRNYKPTDYQSAGRFALEKVGHGASVFMLPAAAVYPVAGCRLAQLFEEGEPWEKSSAQIGVHWYAGDPLAADIQITAGAGSFPYPRNRLTQLMAEVHDEILAGDALL